MSKLKERTIVIMKGAAETGGTRQFTRSLTTQISKRSTGNTYND